MLLFHLLEHGIGCIAVVSVPGWSCSHLRDVDGFGKVHLEKGAFAEAEGNGVLRVLGCFRNGAVAQSFDRARCPLHGGLVSIERAGWPQFWRNFISVVRRERLFDLNAAAMAVHIAEAADIHQNVEAELLPGAEGAKHFVVASAMAQACVKDFLAASLGTAGLAAPNLAVGIFTMLINQGGYEFHV